MPSTTNVRNPAVSVRISPTEREMLETAAAQAHTTLSDFIRRKALEAAEDGKPER